MVIHRKQYSSRDKIQLLRLHLVEHLPVPEICQRNRIHPTVFYRWQRQLFSRGHALFLRRSPARQAASYRRKIKELKIMARTQSQELGRLKRLLRRVSPVTATTNVPSPEVAYSENNPTESFLPQANRIDAIR